MMTVLGLGLLAGLCLLKAAGCLTADAERDVLPPDSWWLR